MTRWAVEDYLMERLGDQQWISSDLIGYAFDHAVPIKLSAQILPTLLRHKFVEVSNLDSRVADASRICWPTTHFIVGAHNRETEL